MLNVIKYNNQKIDFLNDYTGFDYLNYLLIHDDEIIGIITYIFNDAISDLFYLEIKEEFRNKGYGYYLLKNTLSLLNTKKIMLEVNVNNKNAISLYKHIGFKQIAVRKKYYNNDDALIFEWRN